MAGEGNDLIGAPCTVTLLANDVDSCIISELPEVPEFGKVTELTRTSVRVQLSGTQENIPIEQCLGEDNRPMDQSTYKTLRGRDVIVTIKGGQPLHLKLPS